MPNINPIFEFLVLFIKFFFVSRLDFVAQPLARLLKSVPRQSFTLVQRTAEGKFGPNYVRCTTPINNVRITSFFAGEWSRTPF